MKGLAPGTLDIGIFKLLDQYPAQPECVSPEWLMELMKPQMRGLAPGTLDKGDTNEKRTIFGASSSLWKGSSGGPCVLLDEFEGGFIIGLGNTFSFVFKSRANRRPPGLVRQYVVTSLQPGQQVFLSAYKQR